METRFYLKKIKDKTSATIYFSFTTFYGERLRITSKQSIDHSLWMNGYPKRITKTMTLRNTLDNYKNSIDNYIKKIIKKEERQPSKFELSEFIRELIDGKETEQKYTLEYYMDMFLNDESLCLADSTKSVKKIHLHHFLKIVGKNKVLVDLKKGLIESYKTKLKKEGNREIATTNNYLKNLIAFLNWLWKKDFIEADLKKYVKKDPEILKDVITLTKSELKILENATFEEIHLQNQIDIFLFGCYTALSIVDIRKVNREMINENNVINIRRTKNNYNQRIPLNNKTIAILEKYNYKLPFISTNKGSENLKIAFRKLNLRRKVRISNQSSNGKVTDVYKELCEIISWHKSRKTAITCLLSLGISTKVVMQISGHKNESTINRYTNFSDSILIEAMNKME
jgi:integrase